MSQPIDPNDAATARVPASTVAARRQEFSLTIMGWAALGCGAVLLLLLAYFVLIVVPPMTRPTPYFDTLTQRISESATGQGKEMDRLSVDLAVILEYTNADIRALNVQVAFSLVGGLALAVTGILLFAVGAKDAIRIAGGNADWRWQLSTTAPGTLALILGASVMLTGIAKQTIRPLDTWIRRPEGFRLESTTRTIPSPGVEETSDPAAQAPRDSSAPRPESQKAKSAADATEPAV
jgi:hypothetical protein